MSDTENSDKRDALRAKIEANERRIAQRSLADEARAGAQAASRYTKENPLTVIGGAIAVGLLIGLLTKPGRKAAASAATGAANAAKGAASSAIGGTANTVGKAAKKRSAALGTMVADTLVTYGAALIDEALSSAKAGQEAAEDFSDSAVAAGRRVRREPNMPPEPPLTMPAR